MKEITLKSGINNSQLELEKKCLVTEFIGLWGYGGKNPSDAPPHESVKLFEALVCHLSQMSYF
jgi:hypothetical protein